MKKTLLTLSLFVAGMGAAFSQSTIWSPKDINVDTSWGIRYMSAVDANTVWGIAYNGSHSTAATNTFVVTNNGGTFTKGTFVPDTNDYNASNISAVNASIAYVAMYDIAGDGTSGKIRKTVNGGVTWTNASDSLTMFIGATNFPDFVHFWDANNGICLGDPNGHTGTSGSAEYEIWRTNNGGTNWTRVPDANIPNPAPTTEAGLTNSYFTLGKRVWFGTSLGRVYSSLDSGKTWTASTVGTGTVALAGGVQGLAFRDSLNGICWGLATTTATSNSLRKTSNGGATWTAVTLDPVNTGLFDFCAIPGRNSYMSVGLNSGSTGYVTSVTADDGTTWTALETGTTRPFNMIEVQMLDSMHGWAGSFSDGTLPHGLGGMNVYMGPKIALACPVNLSATKTSVCLNDSVTLTAAGANTYSWSASSVTTPTLTVHPTNTATYTVVGTSGSCTNTQTISITVTQVATPTVTMTSLTTTVCLGSQIALNGGGATTYSWTPSTSLNAATGATVYAHPTVNTTYTVIGTTGVCKSSTTFSLTASPTPGPTVTVNTATLCPTAGSVTLTANGATTYSWTPATALSATTGSMVAASPTATTVYMVTGTTGSCLSTKPTTVTVSACTGINQVSNATKIAIYPNPSTGLVTVTIPTLNEGTVMYVTDMIGKEVYKTSVTNNSTNLDLTGLQKGMYMITISNGKSTQVEKIVIGQ